jgi:cysteine desulfurase/selenocysteine lyase
MMHMGYDVNEIRKDFPILDRKIRGKPLVYLDNAATTQKPRQVIDALVHYYEHYNANIHRGLHTMAEEATAAYEEARVKAGRFINAAHSEQEIIFTRNTTESINLVAQAWGRKFLRPGDEIVFSAMEHHSNLVPWQLIALATGAKLRFIDIDASGHLDADDMLAKIGERTKIVAITQMSNVLGTINPIKEIAALAHRFGAVVLVDGAQSVPHMPVDVQAMDCDFLAFSSHKMLGPTGVGVLYGKRDLLNAMDPFLGGGEMIKRVTYEASTYADLPHKFEAGTPNIADVIAFGTAIDYLEDLGMDAVREHERAITQYAIGRLRETEGVRVYGPLDASERGGAVTFNYRDLHPHDLSQVLDQHGIAIRAGHHCAQPLMRRLDVVATARASFYLYNREDEVDALIDGIVASDRIFGDAVRA